MMSNELEVSAVKLDAKKVRYVSMEGIRGIAAIWIAVRHMMPIVYPIRSQTNFLAVDLFFLLSGFVLSHSYDKKLAGGTIGFIELSLMRLIRIYPLYLLGSIFGVIQFYLSNDVDLSALVMIIIKALLFIPTLDKDVLFFPLDYPAWSLFFELIASFFYAGIMFRCRSLVIAIMAVLFGFVFIYGVFSHGSADIGYQRDKFQYGFTRIGFSFSLGLLIYRGQGFLLKAVPETRNIGTLFVFIVTSISLMLPIRHVGNIGSIYDTIAIVLLFPLILVLSARTKPFGLVEKCGVFLGNVSYPIYIFHVPISGLMIRFVSSAFGVDLAKYAPLSGIGAFVLLFALAVLSNEFYDIPIRRQLRMIVVRRFSRPSLQAPS